MTNEQATYRRVLRRETHAPRTIPAVVVASVGLAILLALLIGGVGWLIDSRFRESATVSLAGISEFVQDGPVAVGVGVVLVLLALVLLALAALPGRRSRRARTTERAALLVDDGVIADSVAEAVARRTGVGRGQVSAIVGRRVVSVRIVPTSGIPIDREAAEAAVNATLSGIGFAATTRVAVATDGVIA